jgi:hypothetical protein
MFLFMYSDSTNTIDRHTIMTTLLMVWLYFILFLIDRSYFLYSNLTLDSFIV